MLTLSKLVLIIKGKSTFLCLISILNHFKLYLGLRVMISVIVFSISFFCLSKTT